MEEITGVCEAGGMVTAQSTFTGGVRLYLTARISLVEEKGVPHPQVTDSNDPLAGFEWESGKGEGERIYILTFSTPFQHANVEGAMTPSMAGHTVDALPAKFDCALKNISYEKGTMTCRVSVTAVGGQVTAITIEGRVVDKKKVGL